MKYRILVAGCGTISNEWIGALTARDDCDIVGLADIYEAPMKDKALRYGLSCPLYTDFDRALAELKPDIVCDLTYVACHRDITLKALRAGSNVFGEKPMSVSRESSLEMMAAARETGLVYNVLQNRRYSRGIRGLREAVKSGILGTIWHTCCELYVGADLSGNRDSLKYPMLQDQAIHSFDSARFILGADAGTVYAHSYKTPGSKYTGDAAGACIYEMTDGSVLTYDAVMSVSAMTTSWHSQWRVIGENGTAVWNGFDPRATAMLKGSKEPFALEPDILLDDSMWHAAGIDEMLTSLKAGEKCSLNCFDNYGSVAMEYSAIDSIVSGGKAVVR